MRPNILSVEIIFSQRSNFGLFCSFSVVEKPFLLNVSIKFVSFLGSLILSISWRINAFFAFLPLHLFREKELAQWNTCENKHSGRKWETQFHKKVNGNVIFTDVQSLSFQMFANNGMLLAITIVISGLLLYLSSLYPHHHQVQFNKYNFTFNNFWKNIFRLVSKKTFS